MGDRYFQSSLVEVKKWHYEFQLFVAELKAQSEETAKTAQQLREIILFVKTFSLLIHRTVIRLTLTKTLLPCTKQSGEAQHQPIKGIQNYQEKEAIRDYH